MAWPSQESYHLTHFSDKTVNTIPSTPRVWVWKMQLREDDCHVSIMPGRQAVFQTLWCVMWLDSAVTASRNLQLSAFCKPTSISGRDVNGGDQWEHWHSSCQIHSVSISRLFCHPAPCFSFHKSINHRYERSFQDVRESCGDVARIHLHF